jgi:transposase
LFWKTCVASIRSPSFAGARGSCRACIYKWSKEFLEAGKKRLSGDTERQATSGEVKDLRREMSDLKEALADVLLENRLLKKSMIGDGGGHE